MSCEKNYNDLLKENKKLSEENKKNKTRGNNRNNDLDKFNSLIDQAAQSISCDAKCQKQKKRDELKQKYVNAQSNLARGPGKLELARKNYVIYNKGEPAYNQLIETELTKKAAMISTFYQDNFTEESYNILSDTNIYSGLLNNLTNVFDLYLKYTQENAILTKKLKDESNDILTNERKTYYEDQQIASLNAYYHYILWIIYIVVVLCLVVFSLIYPSQTSFNVKIILVIIFAILPFVSTWILGKIIFIVYWLFGLLPKNVYN